MQEAFTKNHGKRPSYGGQGCAQNHGRKQHDTASLEKYFFEISFLKISL